MYNSVIAYYLKNRQKIKLKTVFPFSKIRIIIKKDMSTFEILLRISSVVFIAGLLFTLVRNVVSVLKA
jgi:hypothetical protein